MRLISALVDEYDLNKFFTLTLDRGKVKEDEAWTEIHHVWSKFRKRMNRREKFRFVAVLESHKNTKYPHVHGFTSMWMAQEEWSSIWEDCGGGKIVWVSKVDESKDTSEYVTKELNVAKYVGKEQLSEGYKKRNGRRTLWRSSGLRAKHELTKEEDWVMIKERVFEENGELSSFHRKELERNGYKA